MWIGNRCYPPSDVQQALESLFGESVGHIKVVQYSIYVRFHWRAIGRNEPLARVTNGNRRRNVGGECRRLF